MPDEIARITLIRIAFVLHPFQIMLLRVFKQATTRTIQQGPQDGRSPSCAGLDQGHRSCALDARPAQELQQQRFRLIVGMVRQSHIVATVPGKSSLAQFSRCGFDAVIGSQRLRY